MSILSKTRRPPFYAVVYTTAPAERGTPGFGETASMLVALAANQPGYLGFQTEHAAEGRTVAVCYWDAYAALADWQEKARVWVPERFGLDAFICATGCLWPWLLDERRLNLETAARSVA
ncbi:MAG: hypothetical protein ACE5GT_00270 [Rhodospirillales bacterium]